MLFAFFYGMIQTLFLLLECKLERFSGIWRDFGRVVMGTLVSRDCRLCGCQVVAGIGPVCSPCADELPRLTGLACPYCALPTAFGEICGVCLKKSPFFDATHVALKYAFPLDVLVKALKYRHCLSLGDFFANALLSGMPEADLIMPMPLNRHRLKERGFNQTVEIARPLARRAGLPLDIDGVERVRNTAVQAGLHHDARRRNMRGAFASLRRFDGLRVAVLDDVMTTGATLDAMAQCLKKAGAVDVINLVVARAL